MGRRIMVVGGLVSAVLGFAAWWRRHPRFGASWVNRVADPWLVRQGLIDRSAGEIGLIEHVGRVSGTVRRTPVHPVPTSDGFRVIVPLGAESQWAQNVLAAGRCRLEVGGVDYDLIEPQLVPPAEVDDVPAVARDVMDWLGFRYLVLHRASEGALATA